MLLINLSSIFTLFGFILGTVLGSLVKALSDRSLKNRTFLGRSYCPECKHTLAWYDLFPVFSYLLLWGKCRYCKKRIGAEYLVVELVMGVLIGFIFWQNFQNFQFPISNFQSIFNVSNVQFLIVLLEIIIKTFFIVVLAILFLTDLKKMFIPDRVILPAIAISFVLSLAIVLLEIGYLYYSLAQSVLGKFLLSPKNDYFQRHVLVLIQPFFLAVLSALLIGGFFYSLIVVTKGKGMGGGDVKLGVFIGLVLGFPAAISALFLAFLTGAVFSIFLIISGKKHFGQTIPFGPFLALGSLIMLYWGNQITDWYLHLRT